MRQANKPAAKLLTYHRFAIKELELEEQNSRVGSQFFSCNACSDRQRRLPRRIRGS